MDPSDVVAERKRRSNRVGDVAAGAESDLAPIPGDVIEIIAAADAPPRLVAHLRAVHDAAGHLGRGVRNTWPDLDFDEEVVQFGAATHDIGKVLHPTELTGPGDLHERDGAALLLAQGVGPSLARFTRTHATWQEPDLTLDDLLVSLADKVWKGKRQEDLEQIVVEGIAAATGQEPWEVFSTLDELLSQIADGADARLAFQNSFPTA